MQLPLILNCNMGNLNIQFAALFSCQKLDPEQVGQVKGVLIA
jgi:hypothetical protein